MVNKLKKLTKQISKEKGDIVLFAIIAIDGISDTSSIIFSAKWINKENNKEIFDYILKLLRSNLDQQELSTITRVGVFNEQERIVQLFKNYKTNDVLENEKINGFEVKLGHIIYSDFPQ